MLATCSKLRLLAVLLLLSWAMPLLLSSTILVVSKAPAVHGDSIITGVQNLQAAKQMAASSPCRKCPHGKAEGSILCNGPMLAIEIAIRHVDHIDARGFLIPTDGNAPRRDVAPDPPPPRLA